jgi:hypothetical protein
MNGMDLLRSQRGLMARVAKGLGLTRAAVATWKRVPDIYLKQVSDLTEIPAAQLRPDLAEMFAEKADAA